MDTCLSRGSSLLLRGLPYGAAQMSSSPRSPALASSPRAPLAGALAGVFSSPVFDLEATCARADAILASPEAVALSTDPEFVTAPPSPKGPLSNTGLNSHGNASCDFALNLDYLTLVFPDSRAQSLGQTHKTIVGFLFGSRGFRVSELRDKSWQFYKLSAFIRDDEGNTVGRIGRGGNGDTWCVSLTGAGCKLVRSWRHVYVHASQLGAHISRVDVAFDDFNGRVFGSIRDVDQLAREGAFAGQGRGRPPRTHFIDDHGSNNGCTVYVGAKGRKELCVYEKGKQLGDRESPWVRCELRMWRTNGELPLEILLRSGPWLRGAYDVLAERLPMLSGESRPEVTRREVSAHAVAATRFLREQCGPLLSVIWQALGDDATEFFRREVFRNTVPSRFRGVGCGHESLLSILREQLAESGAPPTDAHLYPSNQN